jgi:hypothetical protein
MKNISGFFKGVSPPRASTYDTGVEDEDVDRSIVLKDLFSSLAHVLLRTEVEDELS